MNSRTGHLFLAIVCFGLFARSLAGQVVIIDVSGSMKAYGEWQIDARSAVSSILAGRDVGAAWDVSHGVALQSFRATADERWALLPFGSISRDASYPYFARLRTSLSPTDLDAQFPISPSDFSEGRTNKALAEAVAVQEGGGPTQVVRVVMVSDFLTDADVTFAQLAFVNEIEAKVARYTHATFSWKRNRRVQIKLLRFVPVEIETSDSSAVAGGVVTLLTPRFDARTGSVRLSWSFVGPDSATRYNVRLRSTANGATLLSRNDLVATSIVYPSAAEGELSWTVSAVMADGRTIERSALYRVPGRAPSKFGTTLVLLLALGGIAAAGVYAIRQKGLPDFLSALKRPRDTDI